jgi:hypothetical protein
MEGVTLRGAPREREARSLDLDALERKASAARAAGTDVVVTVAEVEAALYWIYSLSRRNEQRQGDHPGEIGPGWS